MKYKTLFGMMLILLFIFSIYFIAANVFNVKTINNRGTTSDISFLKV